MRVFRGIDQLNLEQGNSVLTIGNFDGVHLAHQAILKNVKQAAERIGGLSCVFTFRPHPQEVLRPGVQVKLLTTYDEKLEILDSLGIDVVVEQPFSQDFFNLSADDFFKRVICQGFRTKVLFVGHDFRFGKNREGHFDELKQWCARDGIEVQMIEQQKIGNDQISSTLIREKLLKGQVAEASTLLGRPFFYRGAVVKGDQRGRLLGFPTANLKLEHKLPLPNGVYATWAVLKRQGTELKLPSVTNIGTRPTFHAESGEIPVIIETHVFFPKGENVDIYGETLEVRFLDYFRTEKKFGSFEELKQQIQSDKENAFKYFGYRVN